jgi:hypothetical protein
MRICITVENIETGKEEAVLAGLAVLRQWENTNGKPALAQIDAGFVGPILELAALAHNRKHGRTLSADDFADLYEIIGVDASGKKEAAVPFDPATVPSPP